MSDEIKLAETIQELSANKDLNKLQLPFILKDKIIMSPGRWNGWKYSKEFIQGALKDTSWNERTESLFWEHSDKDSRDWVGEIKNPRYKNGHLLGDVYILDLPLAIKLAYGAKFGISPKVDGEGNENTKEVHRGTFGNWSIVLNPAVKTTFLNSEIKTKMEEPTMTKEEIKETTNKVEIDYNALAEAVTKVLDAREKQNAELSEKEALEAKVKELEEKIAADNKEMPEKKEEEKEEEKKEEKKMEEEPAKEEEPEKKEEEKADEGEKKDELSENVNANLEDKKFVDDMRELIDTHSRGKEDASGLPTEADVQMAKWLKQTVFGDRK